MSFLKKINKIIICRQLSTKTKFTIQLDKSTAEDLEHESIKPRHHPGMDRAKCVAVPERIVEAVIKSLKDFPSKSVWNDGLVLNRYLRCRQIPPEPQDIERKKREIEQSISDQMEVDLDQISKEEATRIRNTNANKVKKLMYQRIYHWKPMEYDNYKSFQYLLGRSAQEYSAIFRIFTEINNRNPDFKPRSYFDFGSGVGTGIWAASRLWKKSIFEYYMVDVSRDMNDLAILLLRDGDENKEPELKNLNFRQFLPAAIDLKYDIVLSAYSLLEIPDRKSRLETLRSLWNKCDRYLIIIEQGTNAGFKLVNEARDYILFLSQNANNASVFAPCPHDLQCPRYVSGDGTPCNFLSPYTPLPFSNSVERKYELYTYVVLEKQPRNANIESNNWPRLVRPTLVRARHSICRMCTSKGTLQEIIFSKSKHETYTYRCARSSDWGDRLPINISENVEPIKKNEDGES